MEDNHYSENLPRPEGAGPEQGILIAEFVPEQVTAEVGGPPRTRRVWLPLLLFVATCYTTYRAGGWEFSLALMTILLCHEMGHFVQAWRYGVHASFPFFIPMPIGPFGTFGAVIGMSSRITNRRALFDIGITGPLAGLVPTIICCVVGISMSRAFPRFVFLQHPDSWSLGEPLLLHWMVGWLHGPIPRGYELALHPLALAGWVGLFVTALNLIPIGQLDGGHVLYAILRRKAHAVATILLATAAVMLVLDFDDLQSWTLLIFLLVMLGPRHPPTANDYLPLGTWRVILGWLTLAFLLIGFTYQPIVLNSGL
jgi:membrane-associated protease RseP (regulator of RpoE activity)